MTIAKMTKRAGQFVEDTLGYHYADNISTGSTGNDILIPVMPTGRSITCTLIAGANTGKFQITTSSDSAVTAGTATWQDWALGTQTGTISDAIISPVTAVRGVSVAGAITIEIVI